jgi:hypothetical protein
VNEECYAVCVDGKLDIFEKFDKKEDFGFTSYCDAKRKI